jgi:glycosyltransferase involved in cell wall biosynthesis
VPGFVQKRFTLKRNLSILLVTPTVAMGGAEMVQRLLADQYLARGFDTSIYSYYDGGSAELFGDFPEDRLYFNRDIGLAELLCRQNFDVLHAVTLTTNCGLLRSAAKARFKGALVLTCHGAFQAEPTFKSVDAYTAVSSAVAKRIEDKVDVPIRVIYNGIDTTKFKPCNPQGHDKPIVLWVGRTHDPMKDFYGLVACAMALRDDPIDLWVASASIDARSLTIRDWLKGRVKILDHVPPRQMPELYSTVANSGGCLLSTSYSEGFPMSILEAMACGCPSVASSVGGIPEMIDIGVNGVLFDRRAGVDEVANLVRSVITDGEYHAQLSQNGITRVQARYSADIMAETYLALYSELLNSKSLQSSLIDTVYKRAICLACSCRSALSRRKYN